MEDLIKKILPKTYYAELDSEARLTMIVEAWRRLIKINQELEQKIDSFLLEAKVKPANGDIAIDILDEKEKYYKKLLKEDVKNHDHIACIVCESKLDFISEMQKELVSRLSV